ncbi:MAG TPA: hypothetical protein VMX17_12150 [Candidatus Glassbacteria bacterium]|nr:hypothetical protein [Candidatus Glassbacteria bacterium]
MMKKFKKIILLIATIGILPVSFIIFLSLNQIMNGIFQHMQLFFVRLLNPNINPYQLPSMKILPCLQLNLPPLVNIGLFIVGTLWGWLLMIFYLIHLVKNARIKGRNKIFWIIAFAFTSVLGMTIYWFLHIWKYSGIGNKSNSGET